MEERFPMTTSTLQSRLGRLVATRLPLQLVCLLLPAMLIAGCATPTGYPSSNSPASAAQVDAAAPAASAASAVVAAASAPASAASAADADADTDVATAPVPEDPLRPEVRLDLDDRAAQLDLWERVRRGFALPDLDNDLVRRGEQWYSSRPDYVQRMTERGGRYLFHIVEELDHRGMPTELALLPFIESAYNPQAMSSAKASGMWQFVPATGKDYALTQNVFRDDRRDVLESTRAALDYLQRLYSMFGDWHLALAAYNWGEGSVQRAIARNQRLGLPTDYSSLKMPNETAYYVPKLQAVKNIIARPADYGLSLPTLANHPYFLSVPIERDMDVAIAVKLAGIPLDEFQSLNPQMNKPVILAAGTPRVLLPYDNANRFVRELPQHRGRLATWTAWTAPKTLRPADVAKQVGMDEATLREVNRIPPRMLVKAGSTLLVPRGEHRLTDVSSEIADNATMALSPEGPTLRKTSLRAGKHDSVASVAKRYRVSTAQVAQWNGVTPSAAFKPGQTIVVFVASKGGRHPSGRTARVAQGKPSASTKSTRTAATHAAHKASAKTARSTKARVRIANN
jgi:membrane-bound lytic murein transglycosylase D